MRIFKKLYHLPEYNPLTQKHQRHLRMRCACIEYVIISGPRSGERRRDVRFGTWTEKGDEHLNVRLIINYENI